MITWGYISLVRPDDVIAVLDAAQPGPWSTPRAMRPR